MKTYYCGSFIKYINTHITGGCYPIKGNNASTRQTDTTGQQRLEPGFVSPLWEFLVTEVS